MQKQFPSYVLCKFRDPLIQRHKHFLILFQLFLFGGHQIGGGLADEAGVVQLAFGPGDFLHQVVPFLVEAGFFFFKASRFTDWFFVLPRACFSIGFLVFFCGRSSRKKSLMDFFLLTKKTRKP